MIHIRQLDPEATLREDSSLIAPLWLALFDHHVASGAAGMRTKPREGSWPQRREHYCLTIGGSPHASLWVAYDEDRPVGYALSFEDALGGSAAGEDSRVEVLETLSLLPETRGRGLGSELVGLVEEEARARGIQRVAIDVMGGNDGALRFYARAGYAPHSKTWMRSEHPEPGLVGSAVRDPGDVAAAEAVFAPIGVTLSTTGRSDDTWVTAPSVAMLDVDPPQLAADFDAWLPAFLRGIEVLAEAGYWTLWVEAPEGAGADLLGAELLARGFSHGMSRVLKEL